MMEVVVTYVKDYEMQSVTHTEECFINSFCHFTIKQVFYITDFSSILHITIAHHTFKHS